LDIQPSLAVKHLLSSVSPINSHAYFRKYSRFVRLRLLGFKTPYFRDLPSQNNTQLFCSVAYRLS